MRLLFAISAASFCTVLWIALALARRIERDRLARRRPAPQGPATEFFEAGEYRTPRPMLLNQQVASIRTSPRPAAAQRVDESGPSVISATGVSATGGPVRYLWPSAPSSVFAAEKARQAAAAPEARTQTRQVIDSTFHLVAPRPDRPRRDFSGERKAPQPARPGTFRRVDLSHYNNEDMGDLTDPYTHIMRPSGVRRAVKNT